MSIFGKIMSAIFGTASAASPAPAGTAPAGTGGLAPAPAGSAAATMSKVDVEAVLTKLAAANKEKLDWRKSIVDLMKLLNLDSSLSARKELAKELHYTGDTGELGVDEHLAAQTGHAETCGKRRQGAGRPQELRFSNSVIPGHCEAANLESRCRCCPLRFWIPDRR